MDSICHPAAGRPSVARGRSRRELLDSRCLARLAYLAGRDPSGRADWFHWNGREFVVSSPPRAPKLKVLASGSKVALTIDRETQPYHVLMVRGTASVQMVNGVPAEYSAAARRYMGVEQGNAWSGEVAARFPRTARIAITPDWVGVSTSSADFPAPSPEVIVRMLAGRHEPLRAVGFPAGGCPGSRHHSSPSARSCSPRRRPPLPWTSHSSRARVDRGARSPSLTRSVRINSLALTRSGSATGSCPRTRTGRQRNPSALWRPRSSRPSEARKQSSASSMPPRSSSSRECPPAGITCTWCWDADACCVPLEPTFRVLGVPDTATASVARVPRGSLVGIGLIRARVRDGCDPLACNQSAGRRRRRMQCLRRMAVCRSNNPQGMETSDAHRRPVVCRGRWYGDDVAGYDRAHSVRSERGLAERQRLAERAPRERIEPSGSALPEARIGLEPDTETIPFRTWAIAVTGGRASVDVLEVADMGSDVAVTVLGETATVDDDPGPPARPRVDRRVFRLRQPGDGRRASRHQTGSSSRSSKEAPTSAAMTASAPVPRRRPTPTSRYMLRAPASTSATLGDFGHRGRAVSFGCSPRLISALTLEPDPEFLDWLFGAFGIEPFGESATVEITAPRPKGGGALVAAGCEDQDSDGRLRDVLVPPTRLVFDVVPMGYHVCYVQGRPGTVPGTLPPTLPADGHAARAPA